MGICWNIGILLPLRGYEGDMIGLYDGCVTDEFKHHIIHRWVNRKHHRKTSKCLVVSYPDGIELYRKPWFCRPTVGYSCRFLSISGLETQLLSSWPKPKQSGRWWFFLTMRPDLYVISCHINKILSCRHRCQGGLWKLIYDIMVIWIYIKEMSVTDGCTFSRGVRSWGHPSKGYMRWLNIALSPVALWIWRG